MKKPMNSQNCIRLYTCTYVYTRHSLCSQRESNFKLFDFIFKPRDNHIKARASLDQRQREEILLIIVRPLIKVRDVTISAAFCCMQFWLCVGSLKFSSADGFTVWIQFDFNEGKYMQRKKRLEYKWKFLRNFLTTSLYALFCHWNFILLLIDLNCNSCVQLLRIMI